jgi:serine/threonine-protein kinase
MAEIFLARQGSDMSRQSSNNTGGWDLPPEAASVRFERRVAIKRILPHLAESPEFVQMFLDEAHLAAQLTHPNIAHIYDFGKVDDSYFIAMEYVDGPSVAVLIERFEEIQLPVEYGARIVADMCAGLHHAHRLSGPDGKPLKIVHRDVSPHNVLMSYEGHVKLVDFGIAKAASQISRTNPGIIKGKYAYMSPEQCTGQELDARSDVFNAGILLFELTTGQRLYKRETAMDAMRAIRKGEMPPPERARAEIDGVLARIIRRALAADRNDRYASAGELLIELEAWLKSRARLANAIVLGEFLGEVLPPVESDESGGQGTAGGTRPLEGGAGTQAASGPRNKRTRTVPISQLDSGKSASIGPGPGGAAPRNGHAEPVTVADSSAAQASEAAAVEAGKRPAPAKFIGTSTVADGPAARRGNSGPRTGIPPTSPAGTPPHSPGMVSPLLPPVVSPPGGAPPVGKLLASTAAVSTPLAPRLREPTVEVTPALSGLVEIYETPAPSDVIAGPTAVYPPELPTLNMDRPASGPGSISIEPDDSLLEAVQPTPATTTLALPAPASARTSAPRKLALPPTAEQMIETSLITGTPEESSGRGWRVAALVLAVVALAGGLVLWRMPGVERGRTVAVEPGIRAETGPAPTVPARLDLITQPRGAHVFIDGNDVGATTPVRELSLAPGQHLVELRHPERPPWNKVLDLSAGESRTLEVSLPSAIGSDAAGPAVASASADAGVARATGGAASDGRPAAVALASAGTQADPGPPAIEPAPIRKTKLRPRRRPGLRAGVGAGGGAAAAIPDGYLSIKSKPWSRVFVGTRFLGITPLAQVRLRPGRHELVLRNPEQKEKRVRINIASEETTKVSVTLP